MPNVSNLLTWGKHKERWQDCQECDLCNRRKSVVLYKGHLPCDILGIGEAPGDSEDVLGKPFVGPAGHIQDRIINNGLGVENWELPSCPLKVGLTNVIACIPTLEPDENGRVVKAKKVEEWDYALKPCEPRLAEIVRLAKPKALMYIGKVSEDEAPVMLGNQGLEEVIGLPSLNQTHPAAIKRANAEIQEVLVERAWVNLADFVYTHFEGNVPF